MEGGRRRGGPGRARGWGGVKVVRGAVGWRYTRGMRAFWTVRRVGLAVGAWLLLLSACAAPRLALTADAEPSDASFDKSFERWTRDASVMSLREMDTSLLIYATLRSRAFQRAYTDRYCKVYGIQDPAERARIETAEIPAPDAGLSFWVQTAAHNDRWNDLLPAHGRWRLSLIDEQAGEVAPETVTLVGSTALVEVSMFNHSADPFRKTWHVKFPPLRQVPAGTPRKLTLRLTGPEGKTDLVWLVE